MRRLATTALSTSAKRNALGTTVTANDDASTVNPYANNPFYTQSYDDPSEYILNQDSEGNPVFNEPLDNPFPGVIPLIPPGVEIPKDASSIFKGSPYSEYQGNLTATSRSTGYYADKLLSADFFDGAINNPRINNNKPVFYNAFSSLRPGFATSTNYFGKDEKIYYQDPDSGGVYQGNFVETDDGFQFETTQDQFEGYFGEAGLESVRNFNLYKTGTGTLTRRNLQRQRTRTALTRRGGR